MEQQFEIRKRKIVHQAQISPQVFNAMLKRLEQFVPPFINSLARREQKQHVQTYIAGLLSDLKRRMLSRLPIATIRTAGDCSAS